MNYKLTPKLKKLLIECKTFDEWFYKSQLPNPIVSSLWMDKILRVNDFEPNVNNRNKNL